MKPLSWSLCGQVCFIDGKGWGLTDKLMSICLGEEPEIKQKLAQGGGALGIVQERLSEAPQSNLRALNPLKGRTTLRTRKVSVK